MKKIFSFAIITLLSLSAFATDYLVGGANTVKSYVLPIVSSTTSSGSGNVYTSITQQIYLPSEFSPAIAAEGGSAGNITALTFFYGASGSNTVDVAVTRSIEIYLSQISNEIDAFENTGVSPYYFKYKAPGTQVFDGTFTTETISSGEVKELPITISAFPWDGSSNLLLTVIDKTDETMGTAKAKLKFVLTEQYAITTPRFIHQRWITESSSSDFSTYKNNLKDKTGETYGSSGLDGQTTGHKYVTKLKFTIEAPVPVPTSPSASSITTSSAVLGWTAAAGANSYEVRYGTTSGSLGAATNVGNVTSYSLTGLTEETTYYYQIRTKIGTAYSAWTDEASFTTLAEEAHIHDGITFSKWNSTNSLPTSGNYFLANDVTFGLLDGDVTLTGDLNLCLNGKTASLNGNGIIIPEDKTLAIFDNETGGKITSFYPGQIGDMLSSGLITIQLDGTLVLKEGEIENTYVTDGDGTSVAICNQGTLKLSAAPVITSNDIDIFLAPSIPAKVITIESEKPLTNTTPYKVYKKSGVLTSGWANMSGADPADYFVSANPDKSIYYNGSEAELISILNLSDNADNSSKISLNNGQVRYVATNRSFTAGMYNTICMPFALSSAQIESAFGAGTDVQELSSSTYDGEYIDMYFSPVSAMAANTPYLINPANDVANAAFNGVTIVDATPATVSTSFVDLIGITSITALTASEDRYLLGANNKLGYLEANGNLKGMRAYFDTHNLGGGAAPAKRLRIAPDQSMPSALDEATTDKQVRKHMENGQLIIIRDGKRYNALGAEL